MTNDVKKNIFAIRTDGNIQPQPSMVVEKNSFEEGDTITVNPEPQLGKKGRKKGLI